MRTAIGLFHLFHSVSVHLFSLCILHVSFVSVTKKRKKKHAKKNLCGFCAVYDFLNQEALIFFLFLLKICCGYSYEVPLAGTS